MSTDHDDTTSHTAWESEGGAAAPLPRPGHEATAASQTGILATGTITRLQPDPGIGYLTSDTHKRPWRLRFVRADVKFHQFDTLKVGDRVRFLQETNPGNHDRQHAILVEAWPDRQDYRTNQ